VPGRHYRLGVPLDKLKPRPPRADGRLSNHDVVRITAVAALSLLALLGALLFLWRVERVLIWIAIAIFLAVALDPVVEWARTRLRLPRAVAIASVTTLVLGALAGIIAAFAPPVITGFQQLVEKGPGYIERLREAEWIRRLDENLNLIDGAKESLTHLVGSGGSAVDAAQAVASFGLAFLTIFVLVILFLLYGRDLRDRLVRGLLPPARRPRAMGFLQESGSVVSGYVAGNLAVSLIAGAVAWPVLYVLGVPYAPVLALWIVICDLIPLVGATLGAIPAVIAAFTVSLPVGIAVLVILIAYQQLENHFIQPLAMRRAIDLNPLATIVAVVIGAELLGIIGALLAVPVAGLIQLAIERHRWDGDEAADPPGAMG